MIWIIPTPFVVYYTFKNMIEGNWLMLNNDPWQWPFLAWAFTIFVGCVISALISGALVGIGSFIGSLPKRVGVLDHDYPLVALREKDGIQGNFYFLGAGTFRDVQYYFWYRRNENGTISGGKTLRDPGVRIHEITDGSAPFMRIFKTEYVNPNVKNILWIFGLDLRDDADWYPDFFIPKGSIKEGYEL